MQSQNKFVRILAILGLIDVVTMKFAFRHTTKPELLETMVINLLGHQRVVSRKNFQRL